VLLLLVGVRLVQVRGPLIARGVSFVSLRRGLVRV
jgi:hypothetical protein